MISRNDSARWPQWPRWPKWLAPEEEWRQSTFAEFLILSMLLHLLGIVLFGSTSGSGTPGGKAYWGTLAVTLPFPLAAPGIGLRLDRGGDLSLPGSQPPKRPERTGSAPDGVPRVAPDAKREVEKPLAPRAETPVAPAPRMEPIAPLKTGKEIALPVELRPSEVPLVPTRTLEPIAPPRVERELAPTVEARPSEVPLAPAQTLERIVPPKLETAIVPPVELRASDVPLVPAPTLERLAPPRMEREMAAPVELKPSDVPLVPTTTLERIAPPKVEREVAAPVELRPSEVPLVPTESLERIAPAPVTRELARPPAELAPAETRAPPAAPAMAPRTLERESPAKLPPASGSRIGPPDVVDDPFSSRAGTPPSASQPAPDAPRLDLDAMRQRARDITREGVGQRAILPFPMPAGPAQKSKEELALDKAWKPDCKTAYADMGLLAMVPLLMNSIGEGTCSWKR